MRELRDDGNILCFERYVGCTHICICQYSSSVDLWLLHFMVCKIYIKIKYISKYLILINDTNSEGFRDEFIHDYNLS